MANWSGFSFGGFDPILSYGTTGNIFDWFGGERGYLNKLAEDQAAISYNQSEKLSDLGWQYQVKSLLYGLLNGPSLQRQGLEAAGYNPILAVNSAAGSPFSGAVGWTGQSHTPSSGGSSAGNPLDIAAKSVAIKQGQAQVGLVDAQKKLVERKADAEGWILKTLTRSDAAGLGANVLSKIGINLHKNHSETFLVGYNVITGEFRNLGSSDSLGTTGDATSADDATVEVNLDGTPVERHHYRPGSDHSHFRELLDNPVRSPFR